jgi:hypothetical protein
MMEQIYGFYKRNLNVPQKKEFLENIFNDDLALRIQSFSKSTLWTECLIWHIKDRTFPLRKVITISIKSVF